MLEKKSCTLVFPEKILSPEVLGLITPPPPPPHAPLKVKWLAP